jgi:hypothetical protein
MYENLCKGNDEAKGRWNQICKEADTEKSLWIEKLRAEGYKASHPNDGWVDRKEKILTFCYPHFDDGCKEGDLVMLGWDFKDQQSIRLLKQETESFMAKASKTKRFYFEYIKPFLDSKK